MTSYGSDEWFWNHQPDIHVISLLVKFSCALGQIMTRYDFLWDRRVILRNVQINSNLTKCYFFISSSCAGMRFRFEIKSWIFFWWHEVRPLHGKGWGVWGTSPWKNLFTLSALGANLRPFSLFITILNIISGHFVTEHFVCGHFRYRPPIMPDGSVLFMQVVLKIGILQWQIVLGDISKWCYKPCGLLFGWLYKTGNTVQYLFYYMYYGDNFTTVCLNKMLFFVKKKNCILPVIQVEFVYILC